MGQASPRRLSAIEMSSPRLGRRPANRSRAASESEPKHTVSKCVRTRTETDKNRAVDSRTAIRWSQDDVGRRERRGPQRFSVSACFGPSKAGSASEAAQRLPLSTPIEPQSRLCRL